MGHIDQSMDPPCHTPKTQKRNTFMNMASISEPNSPSTPSSPSFKQRLKSTFHLLTTSPFHKHNHDHHHFHNHDHHHHHMFGNPSVQHLQEHDLHEGMHTKMNEAEDHKTSFLSRIGKHAHKHEHGRGHRRRHSISKDFRYDASSYALNFDEGSDDSPHKIESPPRNFTSRLPLSPAREEMYNISSN